MLKPLRPILPRLALFRPAALNFLTARAGLIVCALFLLVGLDLAGDYLGLGVDELPQRRIAQANLNYILGQSDGFDALPYPHAFYGVAFELPLLLAEQALGLSDYHYAHRLRVTLTHLLFIIGGFFCYRLACRLFNNRWIALFALLMFLLHPRIYSHSFFNAKDLPFLSLFVIALYLLERAFRKDTIGAFVLLGLAVGLLTNLRIMGVMLVFAVVAMRGVDWFYAASGWERKGILRTAGLFLLAAGLTLYAVTPYAWANPGDYLAASLNLTVNHPTVASQLFQGEWIPSDQLPPHYNPTWFGITTPLPFLLLGFIGVAVVMVSGLRRPGAVLRNNRRRLQWLLLACFLLPPLAAILLSSNQYDDWRHLYFVYLPFVLLAAGGLHWVTAAFAGRRLWRVEAYGLTGLGLGLILLQIAQLYPLPHYYFSPLVARTAPEYLRTQYQLNFWQFGYWAALQRVLKDYPGETLLVRTEPQSNFALLPWVKLKLLPWDPFTLLPPADRERLLTDFAADRNADYVLIYPFAPSQPDLAFNTVFGRVYNTTTAALRPLDSARMTAAARAAYRELYRQAVAGEPVLRADYNVYRNGQRLTFVQENCPPDSRDDWFGARLFPRDPEVLPPRPGGTEWYVSYNLGNHGVRLGDTCLAVLQLPAAARGYLILSRRHPGQSGPVGPPLWEELYGLSPPGPRERIGRLRQASSPAAANAFEVFLDQDAAGGYRLLYAKRDCAQREYETRIFLHIHPENPGDLPFHLWASGFANREFSLYHYGVRSGGECRAVYPLPDYPVESLLTGQTGIWEKRLYPPADPDYLRAAYAALADSQPAASADFDLYLRDNQLTYARETCAAANTAAGFFLHIVPVDVADLPEERQGAGFANADFVFVHYGGAFDGKCLATVPLPDYPIKSIRTGQHLPGQGELWAAELTITP